MARQREGMTNEIELTFPIEGVDGQTSYYRQRKNTCVDAQNARAIDPRTDRATGGVRSGLTKWMPDTVVGDYSIQMIDHLVTTDIPPAAVTVSGQFIYALTSGGGYGIGDGTDGSSVIEPLDSTTGYALACSCWDEDNNVYVAQVKIADNPAPIRLRKYDAEGTLVWENNGYTCDTGSLRYVAGMVIINNYLFMAVRLSSHGQIHRITASTGVTDIFGFITYSVLTNVLDFSTSSRNCLGAVGTTLGVVAHGGGNTPSFQLYDAFGAATATPLKFIATGTSGTAAHSFTTVVSDNQSFFYVITCNTGARIKKINTAGDIVQTTTITDEPIGLAYQRPLGGEPGYLVATFAVTKAVRPLSLSTLNALDAGADPGSITAWGAVDGDGNGNFTVYRNSASSNDIVGIAVDASGASPTYAISTVWGPSTVANTNHLGCSVNKGPGVKQFVQAGARLTRVLAVSNGELVRVDTTEAVAISGGDTAFAALKPVVWAAQVGLDMFFVDGATVPYKYYKGSTDTLESWTAAITAGELPLDDMGLPASLIATYRGRPILAGLQSDPQNFFAPRQFDPFDLDYSPDVLDGTQAFNGNNDLAGGLGAAITCITSFNDDLFLFGCDHEIWQMTGDLMAGGSLDRVTANLGMAWGRPFAFSPDGHFIFFMGSDCRIYKFSSGGVPVEMSQPINARLRDTDLGAKLVRMAWDVRNSGLMVWLTPYDPLDVTENYFWCARTNSWWPDYYGDPSLNPLAVHTFDGDDPNDRVLLLGGRDGYIRFADHTALDDDGFAVESHVTIGPFNTGQLQSVMLKELQATLGSTSADIDYSILVGETMEEALASDPIAEGTWSAGRNRPSPVRSMSKAIYVVLSSLDYWAIEHIAARFSTLGHVVRRR